MLPEWAREAINAVVAASGSTLPLADLPGGEDMAMRLVPDWLSLWPGLDTGPRVTLSPWTMELLCLEIAEAGVVLYGTTLEFGGYETVGVEREDGLFDYVRKEKRPKKKGIKDLDEESCWYGLGDRRPDTRMPKVAGFVPLPFAAMVAAPEEDDEDGGAETSSTIEKLKILGAVAKALRPRVRSKKRPKKKSTRGKRTTPR